MATNGIHHRSIIFMSIFDIETQTHAHSHEINSKQQKEKQDE